MVVAIDFGTTYSGIAYARGRSSETKLKQWYSETGDKFSKTPTTLLLDNQNEFVAFGFDAEEKFKNYIKDDTYKNYRYFKYFKMKLLDKKVPCYFSSCIVPFVKRQFSFLDFHIGKL